MIGSVVEMVRDWLENAPNGADVNSLLPNVPRDVGDDAPPSIVTFADDNTDDWLALGQDPPTVPCLGILADLAPAGEDRVAQRAPNVFEGVEIIVAYWCATADASNGTRNGRVTLRAVRQSLSRLAVANLTAHRRRNEVELVRITRLTEESLSAGFGASVLVGAVVATCTVRDLAP